LGRVDALQPAARVVVEDLAVGTRVALRAAVAVGVVGRQVTRDALVIGRESWTVALSVVWAAIAPPSQLWRGRRVGSPTPAGLTVRRRLPCGNSVTVVRSGASACKRTNGMRHAFARELTTGPH